jgi:broad specificity phosphatase PhoE
MAHRYLYLVRHGQHQPGLNDESPLTPLGEEQSLLTARALCDIPFNVVYHSPARRAVQTAEVIAEAMPDAMLYPSELLRECVPSIPPRLEAFYTNANRPNQLDIDNCARRFGLAAERFLKPAAGADIYELMVCHGNIMRFFVARALQVHPDVWVNMLVNNCGVTRLLVDEDGETYLISHNDIGHMPDRVRSDS